MPLQGDIDFLKAASQHQFTIEGHCDERGSTEYNLALGDSRANAVKNALVQGGVSAANIKTISYGKEKPFCTESQRAVLAAEPPRSFRLWQVEFAGTGPKRSVPSAFSLE